jgi:hypothetical protein
MTAVVAAPAGTVQCAFVEANTIGPRRSSTAGRLLFSRSEVKRPEELITLLV